MIQMSREEVLERINNREVRDKFLRLAIRDAYAEHKRNGTNIVVWQDGKIVNIPAEEIVVPEADEE